MIDGLEVVEHKEVAEVQQQKTDIIQPVDMKTITEFLDTTGLTKQLLPKEKATFVNMAQLFGLNPFKREIYCTVYGTGDYRTCSIVTGYEVYLKRAERTGKMDGWECAIAGNGDDMAATVTIYRKDWGHPFKHTVYYRECVQINKKTGKPNSVWAKMPSFMTKKVAIAQAFRLCFPDEFGGMPYTNDEIINDDEIKNMKSANVDATKPESPVSDEKASEVFDNAVKSQRETMQEIRDKYDADIPETGKKLIDKALADEDTDDENFRVLIGRTRKTLENKGIKL